MGNVWGGQNVCPQISELDLRSNVLTSLPDELAELKTIKNVKLNYNKFTSFPPVLASLPRLLVRSTLLARRRGVGASCGGCELRCGGRHRRQQRQR